MTADQPSASSDREVRAARRLSPFVAAEAARILTEAQLAGDPDLIAQGWERRFITDRRRADEMVDLYRTLGKEVRVEPVRAESVGEDCGDCQLLHLQFCMVYTRDRTSDNDKERHGAT